MARVRDGRARGDESGFTLIEVIIAIVVLMVATAGLMTTLVSGVTATRLNEARTRASQIAAQQIEALRTVKWSQLGVYANESGYTTFHNGESVVTLGAVKPANAPVDLPKIHINPLNVQGRDYYVTTWITWYGSSVATPNDGTTYAQKKLWVDVSYTIGNKTFTYHAEGLRAPTPAEMQPPALAGATAIALSGVTAAPAQTLSVTGMLTQAITLLATTSIPASSVVATYQLADGTPMSVTLSGDATQLHWSGSIPVGTGAFSAGSLTITFSATDSGGTTVESNATVSLASPVIVPFNLTNASVTLLNPQLDASNALQAPLTVTVQASTTASGVTLQYKLADGTTSGVLTMAWDPVNSVWTYTLPIGTGPLVPGNVTFTLTGTPASGGLSSTITTSTTLQAAFVGAPAVVNSTVAAAAGTSLCIGSSSSTQPGALWYANTVTVEVKNIATTDAVKISLGSYGPLVATSLGSTVGPNGGYLFKAVFPAAATVGSASKVNVTASAARSADGQTTAAYSKAFNTAQKKQASQC